MIFCVFCLFLATFPLTYLQLAEMYSTRYGVEVELVLSVIAAESGGNANAVSDKGAIGLMQLMADTALWLADEENLSIKDSDLFIPDINVRLGTKYLAYLTGRFSGDYVLAAYNAGEGNVVKWQREGLGIQFQETRRYVKRVNALKEGYRIRLQLRGLVV